MSEILSKARNESGNFDSYHFWCPGCDMVHGFNVPSWKFDGDMKKPTVSPSLLTHGKEPKKRCHLFIRDGKLQFLTDCFHDLKGKIVDMVPFPF